MTIMRENQIKVAHYRTGHGPNLFVWLMKTLFGNVGGGTPPYV